MKDDINHVETCPVCGQPDNCGDCNHTSVCGYYAWQTPCICGDEANHEPGGRFYVEGREKGPQPSPTLADLVWSIPEGAIEELRRINEARRQGSNHVQETGCGLSREDFHPDGETQCADGGTPDEHPVSEESS